MIGADQYSFLCSWLAVVGGLSCGDFAGPCDLLSATVAENAGPLEASFRQYAWSIGHRQRGDREREGKDKRQTACDTSLGRELDLIEVLEDTDAQGHPDFIRCGTRPRG